jgi:hypothetical protein
MSSWIRINKYSSYKIEAAQSVDNSMIIHALNPQELLRTIDPHDGINSGGLKNLITIRPSSKFTGTISLPHPVYIHLVPNLNARIHIWNGDGYDVHRKQINTSRVIAIGANRPFVIEARVSSTSFINILSKKPLSLSDFKIDKENNCNNNESKYLII